MADLKGYEQLQRRLHAIGKTQAELQVMQIATVAEAKRTVRRKTGHLSRSIVPGALSETHAVVEARTPYAATIEFGSKPHIIRPVKAKVLAWGGTRRLSGTLASGSSPTHFAMLVHHPGTRPYPYLLPAAKKAVGKAKDVIVKLWNDAA